MAAKKREEIEQQRTFANQSAICLLEAWLSDNSGYDENHWVPLKAALEENRLSHRKRFDD